MTTQPITDSQIRALRSEAAAAGDTAQMALCDVALGEAADDYSGAGLDSRDERRILSMDEDEARALCADVIASAADRGRDDDLVGSDGRRHPSSLAR